MKTSSASSGHRMRNYPVQTVGMLHAASWAAPAILHEKRGRNTGGPSGAMHSSIELRKVVERLCLTTGDVCTFVDMPGNGPTVQVNRDTFHVYGTPLMFREEFVDRVLNRRGHNTTHLFTLTEKEYNHEKYHRES